MAGKSDWSSRLLDWRGWRRGTPFSDKAVETAFETDCRLFRLFAMGQGIVDTVMLGADKSFCDSPLFMPQ